MVCFLRHFGGSRLQILQLRISKAASGKMFTAAVCALLMGATIGRPTSQKPVEPPKNFQNIYVPAKSSLSS